MKKYIVLAIFTIAACSTSQDKAWHGDGSRHVAGAAADPLGKPAGQLFASYDPMSFTLTAPFKDLFNHRATPNAPNPPEIKNYSVKGTIAYKDAGGKAVSLDVDIKLRGNTSQLVTECPFPKMKLKIKNAQGTLFEGQEKVGIGTHCGDSGGFSQQFQRLWSGRSPHREALAYRIQELLGLPGYKARPATFTYIESTTKKAVKSGMQAFFLEDMNSVIQRAGANATEIRSSDTPANMRDDNNDGSVKYDFTSVKDAPGMTTLDVARMELFQALIWNYDWIIRVRPDDGTDYGLWNLKVVAVDPTKWVLFSYDYDLAGFVNEGNHNDKFGELRSSVGDDGAVNQAKQEFLDKKKDIEALVNSFNDPSDKTGKTVMMNHVEAFYKWLSNL